MTKLYDYRKIQATAKRLIDRFGGPVSIMTTLKTENVQGWKPATDLTSQTDVKGVFTHYEEKYIDGTVIQRGDQKVLISAIGVTFPPNLTGYVKRGADKWNIVKIEPLTPGDLNIIFKIQVRQ